LASITPGDAADFACWLKTPKAWRNSTGERCLSPTTIGKRLRTAKQFFQDAVDHELLLRNPFAKLVGRCGSNRARDYFVTPEEAWKVLDACPDAEWRALFSLARWGALRCLSEILPLTWADVDWERGRLRVPSPETAHHPGHAERIIPLFPELRQALEELWNITPEGTVYVINRYRSPAVNLRTQLQRIIRRAGLKPWPKLWQNLRATRATELAREYPQHLAAWCGHSIRIADAHYWQVTDADFAQAIGYPARPVTNDSQTAGSVQMNSGTESGTRVTQKAAQQVPARDGKIKNFSSQVSMNSYVLQRDAKRNLWLQDDLARLAGFEPATYGLGNRRSIP